MRRLIRIFAGHTYSLVRFLPFLFIRLFTFQECFTDEFVTEQLTIIFNAGCRARDVCMITIEPKRQTTYLLTGARDEDSNPPAHARSMISLRCLYEETLLSLRSKMHHVTILIRLHKCAGLTISSLSPRVRGYVFWLLSHFVEVEHKGPAMRKRVFMQSRSLIRAFTVR